MKMNDSSIRIRAIHEKDLEWIDHLDREKQDLKVPCFYKTPKEKYTEFLRPSLDLLHFRKVCDTLQEATGEKVIFRRNDVEYTDAFLMVTKSENQKNVVEAAYLYQHGIYESVDLGEYVRYVPYKRSGNAAKKGKHIFIREDFFDEMMEWTWLGYSPKKLKNLHLPYVELKAYEALVNSNIKGVVNIHPDEILLLDDKKNEFRTWATMVDEYEGKFSLERAHMLIKNNVFDGECLVDNSVFEKAKIDAGMMLLRNFFFKSCGFRTDIQGYYRECFGDEYKTATLKDYLGNKRQVRKIKMIVTVSSFKLFKFAQFFSLNSFNDSVFSWGSRIEVNDETMADDTMFLFDDMDGNSYDLWCRKVEENGCAFGVVKHEEEHREKRRFTYQMLNSMHFSEDDIRTLMASDIEKFVKLRTDCDFYESYIGGGRESDVAASYTSQFIVDLSRKNSLFRQTDIYKEKRSNDLRKFKQKLYEGKLEIEADYYTLCSMPWELLNYSINPGTAFKQPILKKGEMYIAGLPEGKQLTLCRNPHACASNVVYATNRVIPELEKWFYFRRKDGFSNIVVISPWEWDVMEALNGADFDSDEALGIKNEIVLKRAKELGEDERISAVPHADISSDKRGGVDMEDFGQQYRIDDSLAGNKIGLISNYTQVLNSYYWDSFREDSPYAACRDELYDDIQILAVLMGLEIDKAKHAYTFEAQQVAKDIMDKYALEDEKGQKRRKRPIFMCYIDEKRHGEAARKAAEGLWLDCPMDYVAKNVYNLYRTEKALVQLKPENTISLAEVFDVEDYKGCDAKKVETVLTKMEECVRELKKTNINKADLKWADNAAKKEALLSDTYLLMEKNKISLKEMKRILYLLLEKEPADRMKKKAAAEAFYECLLVNNKEAVEEILGKAFTFAQSKDGNAGKDYIERSKQVGEKKQINYAKCNKLFEEFLGTDYKKKEARTLFGAKIKKEKNLLNIAYMLQTVLEKRKFAVLKTEKLMSLAILYQVWPGLLLECVQKDCVKM